MKLLENLEKVGKLTQKFIEEISGHGWNQNINKSKKIDFSAGNTKRVATATFEDDSVQIKINGKKGLSLIPEIETVHFKEVSLTPDLRISERRIEI